MQNRYSFDVGDEGKYGLLRRLDGIAGGKPGGNGFRLGVIWYLVDPAHLGEHTNNDGRHVDYLTGSHARRYRALDPALFDFSLKHCNEENRSVETVEAGRILGPGTVYFSEPMNFQEGRVSRQRDEWFARAKAAVKDCDLVFVDPDNGFEVATHEYGSARGAKYVFYREVKQLLADGGRSVIVYQHARRSQTVEAMYEQIVRDLREHGGLPPDVQPFALRWSPWSARIFIVIPANRDEERKLRQLACAMLASNWGAKGLFTGMNLE